MLCTDAVDTKQRKTWPTMKIVQSMEFSINGVLIIDALVMSLKCTATVGKNNLAKYDMTWSGMDLEHSLWIKQSHVTKQGDNIERTLLFMPWLNSHAGEYTCHLVIRNYPDIIMMHNKSYVIQGNT